MRAGKNDSHDPDGDYSEAESRTGVKLFHELARVVVALSEHDGLRSFTLPYPPAAQRALDQTVLQCLNIGERPPRSLPELLDWCRSRSASGPPFRVPSSFITPDATLVHPIGIMPTRTCLELASHGPGVGVEKNALALLADLEARSGSAEGYRRCRKFLACHPVVHQQDRFRAGWNRNVWIRVKDHYRPIPQSLLAGRTLLCCPTCRMPALLRDRKVPAHGAPPTGPDNWCEGEECPDGGNLELIRNPEQAWLLVRPLRAFLAQPRQVEEDALGELDRAGIGYEALSGDFSSYRLRGLGPGRRGMQVYDRLQPALLAARCIESAISLLDLTLVVVPRRFAESIPYRMTFNAALPEALQGRVLLSAPQDLVSLARSDLTVNELEDAAVEKRFQKIPNEEESADA